MIRQTVAICVLCAGMLVMPRVADAGAIGQAQAAAQVSPAAAAPFVGDWTLALQGPNGPGAFDLSVRVEDDKVVADITNEQMPKQAITNLSVDGKRLILAYTFQWEGNPVDAAVTMTPEDGGKMAAQIDFAGGAYVMSGTATKKEKVK